MANSSSYLLPNSISHLNVILMFLQAHQDVIKRLIDLIGITSIMEVC